MSPQNFYCGRTRRELMCRGIATAAAASSVLAVTFESAASADADTDAQVLAATLAVEQVVLVAYRQVIASRILEPRAQRIIRHLLSQELEHVTVLRGELARLGGGPPSAPADQASLERALAAHHVATSVTNLRSQHDCLRLLVDVETIVEGAYYAAISKLGDPRLLGISAAIMACEAQHWTLLSSLQHRGDVAASVPYSFVQGAVI